MKISDIARVLDAMILTPLGGNDEEVTHAFGADLMSDVLRYSPDNCLMLTGLTNIHTLRTAEMTGIKCILYVRGKMPDKELITEAKQENVVLLFTAKTMFEACGILYCNGIKAKQEQ